MNKAVCQVPPLDLSSFKGDLVLTVYPDESVGLSLIGGLEQSITPDETVPETMNVSFDISCTTLDIDLTEINCNLLMKMDPSSADVFSDLEMDILVHGEGKETFITVQFNMPDFMGLDGTIASITDEDTLETDIDFDVALTIPYSFLPMEHVQGIIDNFPTLKESLASQMDELTGGNITLRNLTLVRHKMGPSSATLTFSGEIEGDLIRGLLSVPGEMSQFIPEAIPAEPSVQTEFSTEPWGTLSVKPVTSDIHITFDNEEKIWISDVQAVVEGDIDKQANSMKNVLMEQIFQSGQSIPEMDIVNEVFSTSDLSIKNSRMTIGYSFDGDKHRLSLDIDGIRLKPSKMEDLLTLLQASSKKDPMPELSLTFEGASDENGFMEIQVPPDTTETTSNEPRRVSSPFSNLMSMDEVSFKYREWPQLSLKASSTEASTDETIQIEGAVKIEGEPLEINKIDIIIDDTIVESIETDSQGTYELTHKFEDKGSYEVKAMFNYYEKTIESQILTITVKPPSRTTPQTAAVATAAAVGAVAAFTLLRSRKRVTT